MSLGFIVHSINEDIQMRSQLQTYFCIIFLEQCLVESQSVIDLRLSYKINVKMIEKFKLFCIKGLKTFST